MADYVRGFVIPDVGDVHVLFDKAMQLCDQINSIARKTGTTPLAELTLVELRRAYLDFNKDLETTARTSATQAKEDIIARLLATRRRSDTGTRPGLAGLIRCEPLSFGSVQTGAVGVADVSWLERAINPHTPGYGSYWRAQEYGTGTGDIPSQVGRVLRGYFANAGGADLTPPQAEFAGGGGPHPIFLSGGSGVQRLAGSGRGPGVRGGVGGFGTIGKEDEGRHFIGYGADAAAVEWRTKIAEIQSRTVSRLDALAI
jgi:hypothetical protein